MRHCIPCVGLVVFLGCFTFIIVPDSDDPASQNRPAPASDALPAIVIDPGHGGTDEGTKYYGLAEKEVTLDVARKLERTLQNFGFQTTLTRRDDRYMSLAERVAIANKVENSVFVSIHFNQSTAGNVTGAETFYADQKLPPSQDWTWVGFFSRADTPSLDNGETLAGFIQASLVTRMDAVNRGINSQALYVVRHTRAPAALVEAGFISNSMENQLLRDDAYRQRLANSIAEGIMSYVRTTRQPGAPGKLASAQGIVPKP
jgi:N-acetylmuramoyl-L-alanine amidase